MKNTNLHISHTRFPRLFHEHALFLVAGVQHAKVYLVQAGVIQEVADVRTKTSTFTDREGFAQHHSKRGKLLGTGWVYELRDEHEQKTFLKALTESLKQIEPKGGAFFLFSSSRVLSALQALIPRLFELPIERVFVGNYTKQSPEALLAMIKQERESEADKKRVILTSPEALKILRQPALS